MATIIIVVFMVGAIAFLHIWPHISISDAWRVMPDTWGGDGALGRGSNREGL